MNIDGQVTITVASPHLFVEGDTVRLHGAYGLYVVTGILDSSTVTLRHLTRWQRLWKTVSSVWIRFIYRPLRQAFWRIGDVYYEVKDWINQNGGAK